MSQSAIPTQWLNKFSDPYAVLGISVAADERRILSRYRSVAKLLHPDSQAHADETARQFASQLFARMVNPAYQKLKQEEGRAETLATLRFKVRRQNREAPLKPSCELAQQLMQHPVSEVEVFYEQAIARLAELQYQPLSKFEPITQELTELNLIYLQLKMGEIVVQEKRAGLVSAAEAKPIQFTPVRSDAEAVTENYAQRHYRRAQEYAKKGNWPQVVQELRDAIKIEANQSEYHALLGVAYLHQNLPGMAKVYIGQALKLNPQDPLALRFAAKVGIQCAAAGTQPTQSSKQQQNQSRSQTNASKKGGFVSFLRLKR